MLAIGGTNTGSSGGGGGGYTDEQVRDTIGAALVAGSNVTIAVDDAADTITISASVPAGYSDEQAQDAFASLIAAGTHSGISFVYNDTGNAISATVSAQTWSQITGKPTFATVATSGSYSDLANQPAITPPTRTLTAGTGLTGGGDLSADRSFAVAYGTSSGTSAQGNDTRLSDQRTPTDGSVNDAKVATNAAIAEAKLALASDAAAGTASRRTLGTGATQAAAGSHNHDAAYAATGHAHTGYAATSHTHPASDLTATGTRDSTTFLRGDNTWAAINAGYTPTATKTAAYTAAPGELVMVDASGGAVTVTAPALVAGRTFGVKKLDSSANVVTVAAAGSDTIGSQLSTSFPLRTNDQATYFAYNPNAATNWVATHNHLSLASLDLRYPAATSALSAYRSVSTNTTAVAGEALDVDATSAARTVSPPVNAPARSLLFVRKTGTGTNTVTLSWTISGDTDGVRLNDVNAGATLFYDGASWSLLSTTTAATGTNISAGGRAPTSAGPRTGQYDTSRNLYSPNAGVWRQLRGHVARAAGGALVDVVCMGDSRTAGSNIPSGNQRDAWPSQLRSRLTAAGITSAGTGLVMAYNGGTIDSRITTSGTWSATGSWRQWGATGATATFTSDQAGTLAEVYYYANSGSFTVSIDGGAATTVPAGGGGATPLKWTSGTLSDTTHTVTVTATSTTGYLIGFCVRRTSGLLVHQIGFSGQTSTTLASTANTTLQSTVTFINPSIFMLFAGCNDPTNSISSSTFVTNLGAIMANNSAAARVLMVQSPYNSLVGDWPPWVSAQYDAADNLGLPLLDVNDRWVSPTLGNSAGLLHTDYLHETLAGNYELARAAATLLTR